MIEIVEEDLKRAKEAMESAERNFNENDILTAANRAFVACENTAYVMLKSKFGSTSVNGAKILTKLKDINPSMKETYDRSYDLRVQADYGRESRYLPLNKENLAKVIKEVKRQLNEIEGSAKQES
ncbi:MAG: HEPN domain-containing protein [Nanoarchaeota archaeon]|nr:HEPN domain-containing protein [Nanoarchaeota archaeon]MBU1004205.1 HEPN domain-containing protein [Nanoarchaeota archaeon]MBU1946163.1 HEPN domain-containing protein [Nanoarchaeota archaeon]